jgi:hypothetical protein
VAAQRLGGFAGVAAVVVFCAGGGPVRVTVGFALAVLPDGVELFEVAEFALVLVAFGDAVLVEVPADFVPEELFAVAAEALMRVV